MKVIERIPVKDLDINGFSPATVSSGGYLRCSQDDTGVWYYVDRTNRFFLWDKKDEYCYAFGNSDKMDGTPTGHMLWKELWPDIFRSVKDGITLADYYNWLVM